MCDSLFHDAGGLDDLREEHFALSEETSTAFIPSIKGPSMTSMGLPPFLSVLQGFFRVFDNEVRYAMHESVR